MLQKISHDTKDGDLPSFHHPKLREVLPQLDLVLDCWNLLEDGGKQRHLPQEPAEPSDAYKLRVLRSSYPAFYRRAIGAFAAALSRYKLKGAPSSLEDSQNDIDGAGNSLLKWGIGIDELVMRDNGCLIMVDMPQGSATSRADEIRSGRYPMFSVAERRNVLSWKMKRIGRRLVPERLVIREWREVDSGNFGVEYEPVYRLMKGGEWQLIRIRGINELLRNNGGRSMAAGQLSLSSLSTNRIEEIPEDQGGRGTFLKANGGVFNRPPVEWYSGSDDPFGEGLPLLYGLANFTLDWYREYSDLKELLHKCALPVVEVIGDLGTDPTTGMPKPLRLGPNAYVHFDDPVPGVGVNFKEPSGSSLAHHITHLGDIERLINSETMSFAFGDKQRTATEAGLEAAQVQATLKKMAESKISVFQSLFNLWAEFTGDSPEADSGLVMLEGLMDKEVTNDDIGLAQKLYDSGLIMRDSVLSLMERRGMLPNGRSAEDEDKMLAEEEARRAEEEAQRLNPPIPADVADGTANNLDENGLPIE